ncbi:MAG TPA: alpha/beta hydrolase [Acidimicrobiia bacterium]
MAAPTQPTDRSSPVEAGTRRGRRLRRILRWTGLVLVFLVVLVYAGAGWYVSGEIIDGLRIARSEVVYDTDVLSVDDSVIMLGLSDERDIEFDGDAVMGLRWEGGYGQVGPAVEVSDTTQTRPFVLLEGSLPPLGSDIADFDSFAFPGDPSILGVEFETVTYPAPLGDLEAWYVPGDADTWIVAVHGRNADPTEFLRLIDAVEDLDYPILVITYRNDENAPATDDSLILAGQREWEDVDAAVDFAQSQGAQGVVVYGASMGGGITLSYAMESPPGVVKGLILEAPAADLREIVRLRSGEALPVGGPVGDSILAVGRFFAWLRTGLDFDRVDYTDRAQELDMAVLWFHGTEDTGVPFAVAEQFREARPDLVELHPIPDAVHVRAWNEDPEGFEVTVTDFLNRVSGES